MKIVIEVPDEHLKKIFLEDENGKVTYMDYFATKKEEVCTKMIERGTGTLMDPVRVIKQFWTTDGDYIGEVVHRVIDE